MSDQKIFSDDSALFSMISPARGLHQCRVAARILGYLSSPARAANALRLGELLGRIAMMLCRLLALVAVLAACSGHPAQAQFGGMAGMPGAPGDGGFEGPPAEQLPACRQLMTLREEYQKNGAALGVAQHRKEKVDAVEACKLFKVFLASESRFIQGLTENSATCGVPPQAIKQLQDGHGKATVVAKQVCEAAEHQDKPLVDRPFLFDGILPRRDR